MTRTEVRDFLKSGVDALVPALEFGSGLITDFNKKPDVTLPQVWQEAAPMDGANPVIGAPLDEWQIILWIVKLDKLGSSAAEYEAIVDECDLVAQKLIRQYDKIVSGYKLVTITSRRREPKIKKFANDMSGVLLTFTLNAPDKTNLC